ncbi:MAG: GNAT family N-acetyltransferase [Methanocella sp.]|jgi:GNAT superfamily N-acetyltransferase
MFHIKPLKPSNFDFAVKLANTMDWNMAPEDFTFMASLEPHGSFLLLEDTKPIGIATCISYGKLGWFGNLIVDPRWRRKGAGSMLVNHAVNYLRDSGIETVGLYAYPQLRGFYNKLGFNAEQDFVLLCADRIAPVEFAGVHRIDKENLPRIAKFDNFFFGGDRSRLLESIVLEDGNVGYYISERGHVAGYVAATIYASMAWVGPLICHPSRYDVAGKLIASALAKATDRRVYMVASKSDSVLLDMLASIGFKEEFTVTRMFLGNFEAKNCIYLAESLERG